MPKEPFGISGKSGPFGKPQDVRGVSDVRVLFDWDL